MTPYSLNPPAPSFQAQTQLFISPNNQDSRTFFNIIDPRPTIEIGGFRENDQLQDEKMVLHDDGSSSNCNSSFVSAEGVKEDGSKECEDEDGKNNHGSGKWVSSKMRLMKKMMMRRSMSMSPTTDKGINSSPRFQNQRLESRYSQTSPRNNSSSITRVCSDCNTSTTPLWRSGPKGPKSLCNACGIRQRKARRAMAEAANGLVSPINNEGFAKNRAQKKEKKSRANHLAQFRNKYKSTATTTTATATATAGSSEGVRKLEHMKDFSISLRSNSSFQQVFPRDEVAEAALLLMDLSCGFVHL